MGGLHSAAVDVGCEDNNALFISLTRSMIWFVQVSNFCLRMLFELLNLNLLSLDKTLRATFIGNMVSCRRTFGWRVILMMHLIAVLLFLFGGTQPSFCSVELFVEK